MWKTNTVSYVFLDVLGIRILSLNDGTPEVRDAAFAALAAMAKMVGMRPLERSLEKLDDVKKKKLSDMIGSSGGAEASTSGSGEMGWGRMKRSTKHLLVDGRLRRRVVDSGELQKVSTRSTHTEISSIAVGADSSFVKRSAASMLSGKKPAQAALATKKSAAIKTSVKKADGVGQSKTFGSVEAEDVEPGEMSLEEIEGKLSSLLKAETISQLKSGVWKERLEAIGLLKEEIENIQDLDQSAEILIRFLCAVPGWSEKNVQVQQQVIEVITCIASTVKRFPKRCVVLCLLDIKGFMTDVKPALLSALDAEYEKNPYEVQNKRQKMTVFLDLFESPLPGSAAAPKKRIKALGSGSSISAAGSDGLPREDISAKITPNLLKDLGSPDWKVRLESIESVNKIVEEAHKRIQPAGTVELFGALRGRLYDTNKNLIMVTLATLGGLASAMGPPVEKCSKGILSDVLKCLGDNKKHMRECTLNTLDSWCLAVHLDKMVPYITVALAESKLGAEGRKDLFDWLTRHLSNANDSSDASYLLKPTATALTDKSAEVRKAAECCLGEVLRVCGQEAAIKCMKELKGPDSTRSVSGGLALRSTIKNGKPGSNISNDRSLRHGTKATTMRSVPSRASKFEPFVSAQDLAVQSQALFNIKESNKEDRERLVVRRFKFEEPRVEQIQDMEVLEFLPELFGILKDEGYTLTEAEAATFLPCLTEKSGHNIEKVREKMRELMKQIVNIYSASKFLPYVLEGLRSKNNRTRIESVDFIEYLIDHYGAEISGQLKCLQLVAGLTSERDGEIRKAALNTMATAYKIIGEDVWRYVGKLSDAQRSMLDDRFKWKAREMDKRKEGKPGEARAALRRSVRENG
ncbi:CLASP N terminal [Musa troglodytarum]|uniref:CLASP N terminal n=1 Tax=Musa troglodytarum TaxID=320322 RepID=A0A9E7JHQ4_9LILI|nr:CLASP N terminal [Musa troglodytarum]